MVRRKPQELVKSKRGRVWHITVGGGNDHPLCNIHTRSENWRIVERRSIRGMHKKDVCSVCYDYWGWLKSLTKEQSDGIIHNWEKLR